MALESLAKAWIRADALGGILSAFDEEEVDPCGVLLGALDNQAVRIQRAPRTPNTHPQPDRAFRIAPQDLLAIVRKARQEGLTVVGFWHGHLVGPPELGEADEEGLAAAEALGPSARLLIVAACGSGRARVVRAFTRGRYGPREIPLAT